MASGRFTRKKSPPRSWSDDEPDYDSQAEREWADRGPPEREHDWGLEGPGTALPDGTWHATNKSSSTSLWWQQQKEKTAATFARHGQLHPALGWNFWAAGYRHVVYRSPRCGRINRNDDLRWDKHERRGDRYAVLNDGDEVFYIVATAPAFRKRGSDPYNYERAGTLFVRPGLG